MYKHRLPPLDPLIAFEAAARLLSFTRAGEELHLTQAAISQQIQNLEQSLQVKLFTRSHRAVQLTNEGREFQHTVSAILRQIAGATMDIQNVEFTEELIIGCDQSFAAFWLGPNLSRLRAVLPDISLRLMVADDENESLGSDTQLGIVHGDGHWTGYQSERLFGEEVFPVCSPGFVLPETGENWIDWLLQAPLIDLADSHWNWLNWRHWLSANNIDQPLANRQLQINSYPLVIEAACAGLGVALGWRHLVDDLLDQRKLVRPVAQSLKTEYGYHVVWRESQHESDTLRQFRAWLKDQFKHRTE